MNGGALILAAHGSRVDPAVNGLVDGYVDRLTALNGFKEVLAAYHHGEPSFATVLDELEAESVTVIPLMTSRGYFSDVVLPRELARNRRFRTMDVMQTEPVGTHPKIVPLVWHRVRAQMKEHGFEPAKTSVVLIGHGTARYSQSAEATFHLADELAFRYPGSEVVVGFLDEQPSVEAAMEQVSRDRVVVEPFLIANGPHASRDIPARLGLGALNGHRLPFVGRVGKRVVVCDSAVGTDPGIVEIIIDLATESSGRPRATTTNTPVIHTGSRPA